MRCACGRPRDRFDRKRCKECRLADARRTKKLKQEVFEAYSEGSISCKCCGEDFFEFLTLDHRHGDGYKETLRGTRLYRKLKKEGWPRQQDFQLLCYNCNSCKANHANVCPCPYKKKKK